MKKTKTWLIFIYTKNGFGWWVGGIPKKFDASRNCRKEILFSFALSLILLAPNGCCCCCCTNGFEAGGNCEGNGWEENMFVCCWTGNFGVIPVVVGGTWGGDENGALPNIELFKPDADVWWPNQKISNCIFRIEYLNTSISCISENGRLVIMHCILWTE